ITPFDLMKYEIDKISGYLRVDRPQRTSAQPPTLYGFIPRTYCHEKVRRLAPGSTRGDGEPLDVCVLSERTIARNEIIVRCRVIGGLQMIDHGEADDKIIAVLDNDYVWGQARNIDDVPAVFIERLQHFPDLQARAGRTSRSAHRPSLRPQSRASSSARSAGRLPSQLRSIKRSPLPCIDIGRLA
ncbi:MAG: inorganic diphosphatase, partial [Candidatus Binatia bacterium]